MNKLKNWLNEEKGLYVAVNFNQSTRDKLYEFIQNNNIPSAMTRDDFHSTIIYSTKYDNVPINDNLEEYAEAKSFEVFNTQDNKRCLVIKLNSDYLVNRHKELMNNYNLTYDYPTYNAHITLSYDIGEYDISKLNINDLPNVFTIIGEYKEDLDINKYS